MGLNRHTSIHTPLHKARGEIQQHKSDSDSYKRSKADEVALAAFIASDQIDEATKIIQTLKPVSPTDIPFPSPDAWPIPQPQAIEKSFTFLTHLLTEDPSLSLWPRFISIAVQKGESLSALTLMRKKLADKTLSPEIKAGINYHYINALLAGDETDEALNLINQRLDAIHNGGKVSDSDLELATASLELGRVLENPETTAKSLQVIQSLTNDPIDTDRLMSSSLLEELVKTKQFLLAEKLLTTELATNLTKDHVYDSKVLPSLVWLYHEADRPADILYLIDHAPYWKSNDLAYLLDESTRGKKLPFLIAHTLFSQGKIDLAEKIAWAALQKDSGNDDYYQLLLEINRDNLETSLTQLHKTFRYEERPLIWLAVLQLRQNKIEEAEKSIRAAIAIDPSDGEQGKGDRMRAYTVLAEILDKKGEKEKATTFHNVVKAIRTSEDADDLWELGLLSRALKKYESSLNYFADAYCVQSRLALRYSEQGNFAKAEEHYLRAFELMPDSFGRIESHCFGCEGAFQGKTAQNIADKVFSKLIEERADNPQVYYLLGYLRESQERYEEAQKLFEKAVALDPEYINAWKLLLSTGKETNMSPQELDKIIITLNELDPTTYDIDDMSNLAILWDKVITQTPKPKFESLYPLKSSANYDTFTSDSHETTPRSALRRNAQVSRVLALVLNSLYMDN